MGMFTIVPREEQRAYPGVFDAAPRFRWPRMTAGTHCEIDGLLVERSDDGRRGRVYRTSAGAECYSVFPPDEPDGGGQWYGPADYVSNWYKWDRVRRWLHDCLIVMND